MDTDEQMNKVLKHPRIVQGLWIAQRDAIWHGNRSSDHKDRRKKMMSRETWSGDEERERLASGSEPARNRVIESRECRDDPEMFARKIRCLAVHKRIGKSRRSGGGYGRFRRAGPATVMCIAMVLGLSFVGQVEAADCTVKGVSSAPASFSELTCPSGGSAATPRYFKVTVSGDAEQVVTSIITPTTASCSGQGDGYICTAPSAEIVAYSVYSSQGCSPNAENNNFADESARFSKSIVVCKPCVAGDYYLSLKPLRSDMGCNFKLFLPKITGSSTCEIDTSPLSLPSVCNKGLVRGTTCTTGNQQDGFACLFGSCNMWGWYGLALGIGLFPCLVMIPVIIMMRSSWKRRLAEASSVGPGFAQNLNVDKAAAYNGNDSDDDGVPDELPATFFVADADDT